MSTYTPPCEIEVPREFFPPLVYVATLGIARRIENAGDLRCRLEDRATDDRLLQSLSNALDVRAVFLRAFDTGEPIYAAIIEGYIADAIESLRADLREGSGGVMDAEQLAELARVLRDITAWADEHELVDPPA